jgi:hypothetical protein
MRKRLIVLAVAPLLIWSSLALSADLFGRSKYESAGYEVLQSDGDFEVRKYPELVVVSAPMKSESGKNNAFRQLFQYISGGNEKGEKIAMTTPVFTTPDAGAGGGGVMSFVVPVDVAKAGAPKASGKGVAVAKRKPGKFAVYRYSGRWTERREKAAREKLEAWLKKSSQKAVGKFEKANYDPPFTPGFMRRNEVLVRISG